MSGESEQPTAEEVAEVEAAFSTLRKYDRDLFLAYRLDAMSFADIAEVTGLSPDQVRRRIGRALADLDRYFEGYRLPWWKRWLRWP